MKEIITPTSQFLGSTLFVLFLLIAFINIYKRERDALKEAFRTKPKEETDTTESESDRKSPYVFDRLLFLGYSVFSMSYLKLVIVYVVLYFIHVILTSDQKTEMKTFYWGLMYMFKYIGIFVIVTLLMGLVVWIRIKALNQSGVNLADEQRASREQTTLLLTIIMGSLDMLYKFLLKAPPTTYVPFTIA